MCDIYFAKDLNHFSFLGFLSILKNDNTGLSAHAVSLLLYLIKVPSFLGRSLIRLT